LQNKFVAVVETFFILYNFFGNGVQRVYDEDVNVAESKEKEKQSEEKVSDGV